MIGIKQALERLNSAINTLEFNADIVASGRQSPQGDMFTAMPAVHKPSNQNAGEVAVRLDKAIDAVEKLLKGA